MVVPSVEGSSSSSTNGYKYHAFISFRGVDTRCGFTGHLYRALEDANISTFLDEKGMETGEELTSELVDAIEASRASIVVLSKNYATSTWCLDELVRIFKKDETSKHTVIPVFYHIKPYHVKEDTYGDAIAKHKQEMESETDVDKKRHLAEKIKEWKKALNKVAGIKGHEVKEREQPTETVVIDSIIMDIMVRVVGPLGSALPEPIGKKDFIHFFTSWFEDESSDTGDIVTLLGMGGMGKTYLAKYIYELHWYKFLTSSFIEDISRKCADNLNGLPDIAEQLSRKISKRSEMKYYSVSNYASVIENIGARKKVFLVLDDINNVDQLNALLGKKGFHRGSKIIVTTRNASLTERCDLFKTEVKPKHAKKELLALDNTGSRTLFYSHAFSAYKIEASYRVMSEKVVEYCRGHPLTLEDVGKSLHNQDVAYWEEVIEGLGKEVNSRITDVLKMSYESLQSVNDKELFKHIACFFGGTDRDISETILKACNMKTISGITNLIDNGLLTVERNNQLVMHQFHQEMGRFLVRQESPHKPWKRSRIWCHEDSFKVLEQKTGTGTVLGLNLDMRKLENKKLCERFELETETLRKMDKMMLLQLNNVKMNQSFGNFPENLKWLCMHTFPLPSIPSPMENLVALDLSHSNIESFVVYYSKKRKRDELCSKDKMLFGSLKILNLSFCDKLLALNGFEALPSLERLIATNCSSLLKVSKSIRKCCELVLIDLSYCKKLKKLPRNMGKLPKVETLFLDCCNLGEFGINIRYMDSTLDIPSDSNFFTISLPNSLVRLSLKNNNLSKESFLIDPSCLSKIRELSLDGNPIDFLPNGFM